MARAMQQEHHASANHIAEVAVGLSPIPCLAELLREGAATQGRIRGNQLLDEDHVRGRDVAATVSRYDAVHAGQGNEGFLGTQALEEQKLEIIFLVRRDANRAELSYPWGSRQKAELAVDGRQASRRLVHSGQATKRSDRWKDVFGKAKTLGRHRSAP